MYAKMKTVYVVTEVERGGDGFSKSFKSKKSAVRYVEKLRAGNVNKYTIAVELWECVRLDKVSVNV